MAGLNGTRNSRNRVYRQNDGSQGTRFEVVPSDTPAGTTYLEYYLIVEGSIEMDQPPEPDQFIGTVPNTPYTIASGLTGPTGGDSLMVYGRVVAIRIGDSAHSVFYGGENITNDPQRIVQEPMFNSDQDQNGGNDGGDNATPDASRRAVAALIAAGSAAVMF